MTFPGPGAPLRVPPSMPTVTVQPYHRGQTEPYAWQGVVQAHQEALYGFGEYTLFFLMWTPRDAQNGLVGGCPLCQGGRISRAYKQPVRMNCPNCWGTGFNGGYRAKIIRPALWSDDNVEDSLGQRGYTRSSNMTVESTNDFSMHNYDYAVRSDNDRYRTAQAADTTYLRTGFGQPQDVDSAVGMNVASARLEPPGSTAYLLPPTDPAVVASILSTPVSTNTPKTFSSVEEIRGPLIV